VSVLVVVLVVAAVGLVAWYAYQSKQKRREALFVFATQHGLDYAREDSFDLSNAYGFALFRKGDGRGCENVVAGSWEGLPVRESDYWYYEQTSDGRGGSSRTYSYFSVVVADLTCSVPHLIIGRETLMTKLADHLGFRDIEFESEQFNRAFRVASGDREFAFRLIDARMMQWLLGAGTEFGFEVLGPNLLVSSKRRTPAELPPLFEAAVGFNAHIPDLVRREDGFGGHPSRTVDQLPEDTERSPS
jgi:hypothetical protein